MAKVCGLELDGLVKDGQENCFVPIQKITVGLLLKTAEEHCKECRSRGEKCGECCLATAIERAKWTLQQEPFMDGDFNVLPPQDSEAKKGA